MLEGKVVLVTGAAIGIGAAIAREVAKEKATVIIHYYESKDFAEYLKEELKEKYHTKSMVVKCDLKNEIEIKDMVDKIKKRFKKVDILVNNAALEFEVDYEEKTKDSFTETLQVNLVGPFLLSRYIGNMMYENKYGKIINISSNNAINKYDPNTLEYDASKSALISLTHNLAIKYAPYVNVNAIAPGWINSERVKYLNDQLSGILERTESKKILKRRFGEVEEVANLVTFLASDKADYINNEVITIDGGTL